MYQYERRLIEWLGSNKEILGDDILIRVELLDSKNKKEMIMGRASRRKWFTRWRVFKTTSDLNLIELYQKLFGWRK